MEAEADAQIPVACESQCSQTIESAYTCQVSALRPCPLCSPFGDALCQSYPNFGDTVSIRADAADPVRGRHDQHLRMLLQQLPVGRGRLCVVPQRQQLGRPRFALDLDQDRLPPGRAAVLLPVLVRHLPAG